MLGQNTCLMKDAMIGVLCVVGRSALQWVLQQCAVAAVPLHSTKPGEQAE